MSFNWELIVAAFFIWLGLRAIADALDIIAARLQSHTEVVRLATLPRPHLAGISTPRPTTDPSGKPGPWPTTTRR